ncbi:MAG: SPASM domain-containing protein [Burkholderiales bacterium]|nr:SPASM domain-containing protein [Burkholderiales bacterium]
MSSKRIPLFAQLEIETRSTCNRACAGCLRNSHPDRGAVSPWFEVNELPTATIIRLFDEAVVLGFQGIVCLQHYNEPLQDARLPDLARAAKVRGFAYVFTCTNGDFLDQERAAALDGVIDELQVALYMDEPQKTKREAWIRSLFAKTRLTFTGGGFIPTHFSPLYPVEALARRNAGHPCHEPLRRMIVNHRGDMLFCCDDLIGHFELGSVHQHTIEELWYSDRHQDLVLTLQHEGGRSVHAHCLSCPRP